MVGGILTSDDISLEKYFLSPMVIFCYMFIHSCKLFIA